MTALAPRQDGVFDVLLTFEDWILLSDSGAMDHITGKVELIDGRLEALAPISNAHGLAAVNVTAVLRAELARLGREGLEVAGPCTVVISSSRAVEPDAVVKRPTTAKFVGSDDVVLAIEISATSLRHDTRTKQGLYAEAGVPEYWVVDLASKRLWVFREPAGETYLDQDNFGLGETVMPLFDPEARVRIADLLPF